MAVVRGVLAGFFACCAIVSGLAALACAREAQIAEEESAVRWWLLAAGAAGTSLAFTAGMLMAMMGATMRL